MSDDTKPVKPRRTPSAGYVKLHRSIWHDPDFTAMSAEAQHMYLLLMSQPDITHVGIVPYMPARWCRLSASLTVAEVESRLCELLDANFVLVDHDTDEVLVRSYAVYDEAWKLTNGPKSLVNAHAKVYSARLRNAILTVLATLDVTVDATVESTVEVTVSAHNHKTQPLPAPPADTRKSESKVHPQRKATLFAAAAEIVKRCPPAGGITNYNGLLLRIAARLGDEHPNVDSLIDALGADGAATYIADADTPAPAGAATAPTSLQSARDYGASVKHQQITGEYADMPDYNREAFMSELRARNEGEEWHNAAIAAYDEYTTTPNLRAV